MLFQVGKDDVAVGVKLPAAVLLANVQVLPPSMDVASNPHDQSTLAIGTKIEPCMLGWNICVIV
ncbi:MAG: hypothetical protein ACHQKY_18040 [Terriglobia bacterium]